MDLETAKLRVMNATSDKYPIKVPYYIYQTATSSYFSLPQRFTTTHPYDIQTLPAKTNNNVS
jgi:hypothetical protein